MKNSLSPEQKYLRNALRWSLLEVAEKNGLFFENFQAFDIGKTWEQERDDPEHNVLGCVIWNKEEKDWKQSSLLHMKGVVKNVLASL